MLEDMEALGQTIQNLIIMRRGTYPNSPGLGVGIEDYLFEILDNQTISEISANIDNQLAMYIVSNSVSTDVKVRQLNSSNANVNSLKIDIELTDNNDASSSTKTFSFVFAGNSQTKKLVSKLVLG